MLEAAAEYSLLLYSIVYGMHDALIVPYVHNAADNYKEGT